MSRREKRDTLKEAHDVFACELQRCAQEGVTEPQEVAARLANAFSAHFGGTELYVPKNTDAHQAERDAEIWAKHNGRNTMQLARLYGLSSRTIERIMVREAMSRQGRLFDRPQEVESNEEAVLA